jgi:hypothetical protein
VVHRTVAAHAGRMADRPRTDRVTRETRRTLTPVAADTSTEHYGAG